MNESPTGTGPEGRTGAGTQGGRGTSSAARAIDEFAPEVSRQIEQLRGRLEETLDQATDFIRARPGTSLLVAAGLGYLVGRIVRS